MALNIEKITANPNAQVFIHAKGGKTLVSFISDDIGIGSSADWQSPMDTVGGAIKTVQSLLNLCEAAANSIADAIGVRGFAEHALRAYATTVVDYMGTNKPTFNLSLIFPAIKNTDDPRVQVLHLLECVYPSVRNGEKGATMRAPLGYEKEFFKTGLDAKSGYVDIQIGRWLSLHKLVVNNVQTTFSKEVIRPTNVPLYAKVTAAFTFIKTPSFQEVINWFTGVNYTATQYADPTQKNQVESSLAPNPAFSIL